MATPINAPMAGEIWHLSIEDLFQPVQEAPRLGGEGPFVINLSVSTAPISVPSKSFTNQANAHVYQIQVTEDGRARFRLRLGPFATEDEADGILAAVRETYPGALTATASGSDLRVIASLQAKVEQRQSAAQKTTEKALPAAEISIDIAWPTPELAVPPRASLRTAPPVIPPATPKIVSAPVAVAAPVAAAAPVAVATPVAAAAPVAPAVPAAAPAPPVTAAPKWTLPELDVPLPMPPRPVAPAKPVLNAAAPAAPKPSAANFSAPLAIVNDAPLLTEVVLRTKRAAPKNKPAAAALAPILTDAVMPKTKTPVAPATTAPAAIVAKAAATVVPTVAPKVVVQTPVVPAPIAPTPIAQPVPVLLVAAATPAPKAPAPISLTIAAVGPPAMPKVSPPAPPSPKAPAIASSAPKTFAVSPRAVAAPVITQSVAPRNAAAYKARGGITKPMTPSKLTSLQHVVVGTAPARLPREVKKLEQPLESLESTQTIRALTPKELEDNESRWFVIQLSLADHAFDPDSVPNLDLFSEYRLYSVAGLDQGRVVHALRLGFFREEIAAVAVASYLAAYWDKPTIRRVSVAERERFADQRVDARKDVGATGKHAVIEITDELVARRRRSSKAAVSHVAPQRPIEH